MSYTSEDVRREADEYREWARQKDREQLKRYLAWIRENRQYIKKEKPE